MRITSYNSNNEVVNESLVVEFNSEDNLDRYILKKVASLVKCVVIETQDGMVVYQKYNTNIAPSGEIQRIVISQEKLLLLLLSSFIKDSK